MSDLPSTPKQVSASVRRPHPRNLRAANPGMSLAEAVQRWDAGERSDDNDTWEYAWRWADKGDDSNQTFAQRIPLDHIKEWCARQSEIAPVTLVRRPRTMWTEVDFR